MLNLLMFSNLSKTYDHDFRRIISSAACEELPMTFALSRQPQRRGRQLYLSTLLVSAKESLPQLASNLASVLSNGHDEAKAAPRYKFSA
jgi:hypothetical protein